MKHLSTCAILLFAASVALTGCNKKDPAQQVKSNGLPKAGTTEMATASASPVAVVDIATLAAQSDYCKEGQKVLENKQNTYRQQLNAKGQKLQNDMINFQKKAQQGGFTSQQEAEAAQARLQKQQQELQKFQERIEADMAKATQQYQTKLRDDINAFLKEYNKDGRFKVIISKSGDNVLYTDPSVDITNDVIEGLNKIHKK